MTITTFVGMVSLAITSAFAGGPEPGATAQHKEPLITFVELGSTKCTPCRRMQPVIKSVEEKYGDQIRVIFYDVWKEEHRQEVLKFKVRLIPTQVFLDSTGKEVLRHEGFFPEDDIDDFLQSRGLKSRPVVKD